MSTIRITQEYITRLVAQTISEEYSEHHVEPPQAPFEQLILNGRPWPMIDLYKMALDQPEFSSELIGQYLETMFAKPSMTDLETAKNRILPKICPAGALSASDRHQIPHWPFANQTLVAYVIDHPNKTVPVLNAHLEHWRIDAEELHARAMRNLDFLCFEDDLTSQPIHGGDAVVFETEDGFAAARILCEDLRKKLLKKFGGNFLMAAPARDLSMAFSLKLPEETIAGLMRHMQKLAGLRPFPVSGDIFYVSPDGVSQIPQIAVANERQIASDLRAAKDMGLNFGRDFIRRQYALEYRSRFHGK